MAFVGGISWTGRSSKVPGRRSTCLCRMSAGTVLVTGSTDGIGLHTASNLARMGYRVLVHGRSEDRVERAAERVSKEGGEVDAFVADFASLNEVRELGDRVAAKYDRLDILINNAGVYEQQRKETADGFELTFGVNVIAPFVLTRALIKPLMAGPSSRIVNVASISHYDGGAGRRGGEFDFENLQHEQGYSEKGAYGLSKLSMIAYTYELAERLHTTGVTVNTCDPGTVNTKMLLAGWGKCGIDVSKADHETYLATSPEVEGITGKYFVGKRESRSSASTYDKQIRTQLWAQLESLSGVSYDDILAA